MSRNIEALEFKAINNAINDKSDLKNDPDNHEIMDLYKNIFTYVRKNKGRNKYTDLCVSAKNLINLDIEAFLI